MRCGAWGCEGEVRDSHSGRSCCVHPWIMHVPGESESVAATAPATPAEVQQDERRSCWSSCCNLMSNRTQQYPNVRKRMDMDDGTGKRVVLVVGLEKHGIGRCVGLENHGTGTSTSRWHETARRQEPAHSSNSGTVG